MPSTYFLKKLGMAARRFPWLESREGSVLFLLARPECEAMQEHRVFSVSLGFEERMASPKAGGEKTPEEPM